MTQMDGTLIENLIETVQIVEHNHHCFQCGAALECEPDECVLTNEQIICAACDWMSR